MADILDTILAVKRDEVAAAKRRMSEADVRAMARLQPKPLGFARALRERIEQGLPAVIAEIKRASPSKGVIRKDFDAAQLAVSYAKGGATCISVLTDEQFFRGSRGDLVRARAACTLPILRKEFIIDDYQVIESRALGADCILLIVAALPAEQMRALAQLARQLGMAVLVEVHDKAELVTALTIDDALIGINNRDLRTFKTDISTSVALAAGIDASRLLISESGIHHKADLAMLAAAGIHAYLIGEAFMIEEDPGLALKKLVAGASGSR
jgi:indole-3-glycerol phosphate synthase